MQNNRELYLLVFVNQLHVLKERLLGSLVSPKKPTELKFAELVEVLQKHYNPKQSVIVQHYRFSTRNHLTGETIASYIAELRHLAEHCEFGTTLNAML